METWRMGHPVNQGFGELTPREITGEGARYFVLAYPLPAYRDIPLII